MSVTTGTWEEEREILEVRLSGLGFKCILNALLIAWWTLRTRGIVVFRIDEKVGVPFAVDPHERLFVGDPRMPHEASRREYVDEIHDSFDDLRAWIFQMYCAGTIPEDAHLCFSFEGIFYRVGDEVPVKIIAFIFDDTNDTSH